MTTLQKKIAFITGGSRGLGRQAALRLAQKGADIIFTYAQNESAAEKTAGEIAAQDVRVEAFRLDLSADNALDGIDQKLENILAGWQQSQFDFLINNAGITSNQPFGSLDAAAMDESYTVNFKGQVLLTQQLTRLLRDGGRIITMGTGLTRVTFAPMVAYACMKAALENFTRYLAADLGSRGITVNAIAPGGIDNDFNADRFAAMPQMRDFIASNTALGRVGRSEDIGGIAAFLCSPEAGWITGQRIEASGGFKL